MASSIAIVRLLQQLLKRTHRQNKTIDKYQIRFLKKLQSASTMEAEIELFDEYSQQLEAIPNNLDDKLLEGHLVSRQSQAQLQQIQLLSSSIHNRIEEMKSSPEPYTVIEYHSELKELIKIYQRAVIELSKSSNKSEIDNKAEVEFINDELQLLILELDVGQAYVKKLDQVRLNICNESDPFKLPHHCLHVITIIINSTREERRSSRHFLYTLNDSLTQFYLNFAQTLKITEKDFEKQKEAFVTIKNNAKALKENSEKEQTIESLRKNIAQYAINVEEAMVAQEKQQEEKFRCKFQGMVRQIKELQNETQSYQKTLKQQNKQLHIDFLTKIPNRAAWSERLKIEVTRFKRYKNTLNIAIIDIDSFKSINDSFGHLAGDKVLNVIAQTLQKSIRNADYLARYGGEEFALLLPEISPAQTELALNKLRERIKAIPFQFKKENLSITISIGFTTFLLSDSADDAFERADTALYQAKNAGRDQVVFLQKDSE
ncbi:GGDEF domain-containing protein [Psychromonas sp. SP041]|uniref:GGDEF domain-containing protein n=1 Tax=Psychromonas sp. SP041 TaxID=1365007 RepID=UPI0004276C77|nr:GGDEF domain-containing protein [Psychromonas sp. SP041]